MHIKIFLTNLIFSTILLTYIIKFEYNFLVDLCVVFFVIVINSKIKELIKKASS